MSNDCQIATAFYIEQAVTGLLYTICLALALHQWYLERFATSRPSKFMTVYRRLLVLSTFICVVSSIDPRSVLGIIPLRVGLILVATSTTIAVIPFFLQSFSLVAGTAAISLKQLPKWIKWLYLLWIVPWYSVLVVRAIIMSSTSASEDDRWTAQFASCTMVACATSFILTTSLYCRHKLTFAFGTIKTALGLNSKQITSTERKTLKMLRLAAFLGVCSTLGVLIYAGQAILLISGRGSVEEVDPCDYWPKAAIYIVLLISYLELWFVWTPWSVQRQFQYDWKASGVTHSSSIGTVTSSTTRHCFTATRSKAKVRPVSTDKARPMCLTVETHCQ